VNQQASQGGEFEQADDSLVGVVNRNASQATQNEPSDAERARLAKEYREEFIERFFL
jgi:hypothetical protein